MNAPSDTPGPDAELDARLRRALDDDAERPPAAVRRAILDEARRIADAAPSRPPAANDVHWRVPAAAAVVALVALLVALPLREPAPVRVSAAPAPPMATVVSPSEDDVARRATAAPANSTAPSPPTVQERAVPTPREPASPRFESALSRSTTQDQRVATYADRASLGTGRAAPPAAAESRVASSPVMVTRPTAASAPPVGRIAAAASDGRSALLDAVAANDADAVRRLLTAGADPNLADAEGVTPLALAGRLKAGEIERLLRAAGAH